MRRPSLTAPADTVLPRGWWALGKIYHWTRGVEGGRLCPGRAEDCADHNGEEQARA